MNLKTAAISKPENWQAALGLLPIFLRGDDPREARYVLLNGSAGNLCLDVSRQDYDPKVRASTAWSCNVGHYLSVNDEKVELIRWDVPERVERYTLDSVASNLTQFHRYVEKNVPDATNGIANFYSRAFRRLRSICDNNVTGHQSLRAFLYLVGCAMEDRQQLDDQQLSAWAIPMEGRSFANQLKDADRESILDQLVGVGTFKSLQPDLRLVIRHASGILFEDAHRLAQQDLQLPLPGMAPDATLLRTNSRESLGVHFTPPAIARTLAEEALDSADLSKPALSIFDPACGSAELLKEIIRQLERREYSGTLTLTGIDVSPAACDKANFTLAYEKRFARNFKIEFTITTADALTVNWPADYDIVIMNPPFKRWIDLQPDQQNILTHILDGTFNKPNYANGFLLKALASLANHGVLAAVAPKAVFQSESAQSIRRKLAETLSPRLVARLGSQDLFRDTLVDAGLYVGVRAKDARPATALWADQAPGSASYALRALRTRFIQRSLPISNDGFSVYADAEIARNSKPWAPRKLSAIQSWKKVERNTRFIKSNRIFDIKQGARMGSNVFVVDRGYKESLSAGEQTYFRPALLNSSIAHGRLNDDFYVFFPHTPGLDVIDSEAKLLELVPQYASEYLLPNRTDLERRKSMPEGTRWWEMIRPRPWQYTPKPKLVSKYFGGCGSFAWDTKGAHVVIVGYAWCYIDDVDVDVDLRGAYGICTAVYLNLPETEDLLDYLSVRIGGGQLDLSSQYLKQLLIPNFRKMPIGLVTRIAELASEDVEKPEAQTILRQYLAA